MAFWTDIKRGEKKLKKSGWYEFEFAVFYFSAFLFVCFWLKKGVTQIAMALQIWGIYIMYAAFLFILMEATEGQQIKADLVKIRNMYPLPLKLQLGFSILLHKEQFQKSP